MSEEPRVLGGRYEVGQLIGRGGMAEVHAGHDLRLGRSVAIKILRTDLARDSSFLARFRREAQAAAGLSHPAIVAVYDSGDQQFTESGGADVHVPYIVMEHVEGRTLRDLLNDENVLDPDEAARISAAVLAALEFSHDRGIVHRDIKPANVMVTRGGAVKVMDFGIARALADAAATMTQTQAVLGTARYLSPEQAQGQDVDARSDLYSAGCLFYELLTGRTPFVGDPVSLVYQHLGQPPKAPSSVQPDLPGAMDAVALHALQKSPDGRYQSAAQFRDDLGNARAGRPVSAAAQATYDRVAAGAGAVGAAGDTAGTPPEAVDVGAYRGAAAGAVGAAAGAAAAGSGGRASGERPVRRRRETEDDYEQTDEIPVREERHRGGWLVLAVLALLALAGVGWVVFQVLGPGAEGTATEPTLVAVPSLINLSQEQAEDELSERGLVADPESVASVEEEGTVIGQDPEPDVPVEEGSTVEFDVSAGPDTVEIPDVRGSREDAARTMLEQRNITVADEAEEVMDLEIQPGEVAGTDPGAGQEVNPDTPVTLIVANDQTTVPDVVDLDSAEAITLLRESDLGSEIEQERTDESEPGTVLSQSEDEGDLVERGTQVVLTVAQAPRETQTRTKTITETETITTTPSPTSTPSPTPTTPPPTPAPTQPTPTTPPPTPTPTQPTPTTPPPTPTPTQPTPTTPPPTPTPTQPSPTTPPPTPSPSPTTPPQPPQPPTEPGPTEPTNPPPTDPGPTEPTNPVEPPDEDRGGASPPGSSPPRSTTSP